MSPWCLRVGCQSPCATPGPAPSPSPDVSLYSVTPDSTGVTLGPTGLHLCSGHTLEQLPPLSAKLCLSSSFILVPVSQGPFRLSGAGSERSGLSSEHPHLAGAAGPALSRCRGGPGPGLHPLVLTASLRTNLRGREWQPPPPQGLLLFRYIGKGTLTAPLPLQAALQRGHRPDARQDPITQSHWARAPAGGRLE